MDSKKGNITGSNIFKEIVKYIILLISREAVNSNIA